MRETNNRTLGMQEKKQPYIITGKKGQVKVDNSKENLMKILELHISMSSKPKL